MALIPGILPNDANEYPLTPQELLVLFASYLTAPETKKNRPAVSIYALGTGATINAGSNSLDETIVINNGSTYAAQTVNFPAVGNAAVGQILRVFAKSEVTSFTPYANGNTLLGTAVTALTAGQTVAWQKIDGTNWVRIQ